MAFFPRNFYNSDSSYAPLFRFLDDFDNYSRQGIRRTGIQHWQPKFDVRETEQAYELHGEFPGMKKEGVHIEFTEPQTMVIRGRTERTYTSGTPPAGFIEDTTTTGAITEGNEEERPKSPHQATVEDDVEDGATKTDETPKESQKEAQVQEIEKAKAKPAQKKPVDNAKYWLTERSVGEFSRSFNFPTRVEQDGVTANFADGILTVVVPKAKKHEARRITVA